MCWRYNSRSVEHPPLKSKRKSSVSRYILTSNCRNTLPANKIPGLQQSCCFAHPPAARLYLYTAGFAANHPAAVVYALTTTASFLQRACVFLCCNVTNSPVRLILYVECLVLCTNSNMYMKPREARPRSLLVSTCFTALFMHIHALFCAYYLPLTHRWGCVRGRAKPSSALPELLVWYACHTTVKVHTRCILL